MRPAAEAKTALKDPVNLSSGRDLYLFEQDVGCAEAIAHFRHAHGELGKRLAQDYQRGPVLERVARILHYEVRHSQSMLPRLYESHVG
jgi:hypothetical protein